jgi:hypothetical protein
MLLFILLIRRVSIFPFCIPVGSHVKGIVNSMAPRFSPLALEALCRALCLSYPDHSISSAYGSCDSLALSQHFLLDSAKSLSSPLPTAGQVPYTGINAPRRVFLCKSTLRTCHLCACVDAASGQKAVLQFELCIRKRDFSLVNA